MDLVGENSLVETNKGPYLRVLIWLAQGTLHLVVAVVEEKSGQADVPFHLGNERDDAGLGAVGSKIGAKQALQRKKPSQ